MPCLSVDIVSAVEGRIKREFTCPGYLIFMRNELLRRLRRHCDPTTRMTGGFARGPSGVHYRLVVSSTSVLPTRQNNEEEVLEGVSGQNPT